MCRRERRHVVCCPRCASVRLVPPLALDVAMRARARCSCGVNRQEITTARTARARQAQPRTPCAARLPSPSHTACTVSQHRAARWEAVVQPARARTLHGRRRQRRRKHDRRSAARRHHKGWQTPRHEHAPRPTQAQAQAPATMWRQFACGKRARVCGRAKSRTLAGRDCTSSGARIRKPARPGTPGRGSAHRSALLHATGEAHRALSVSVRMHGCLLRAPATHVRATSQPCTCTSPPAAFAHNKKKSMTFKKPTRTARLTQC